MANWELKLGLEYAMSDTPGLMTKGTRETPIQ